jgi:hypothetical protein
LRYKEELQDYGVKIMLNLMIEDYHKVEKKPVATRDLERTTTSGTIMRVCYADRNSSRRNPLVLYFYLA